MVRKTFDSLGSAGMTPVTVELLGLNDLDGATMDGLAELYPRAYHNSKMYSDLQADIERQPEIFMLTVAREGTAPEAETSATGRIIGARLIRDIPHNDTEDHFGYPAVHGSRFCVDPSVRGFGIGGTILQAGNRHCFEEMGYPVVFGGSNEVGAMHMYAKNGAMFHQPSIEAYGSNRNDPEVSLRAFATFITSKTLYGYRMTGGQHIRYAYPDSPGTAAELERLRFYPIHRILAHAGLAHLLGQTNAD